MTKNISDRKKLKIYFIKSINLSNLEKNKIKIAKIHQMYRRRILLILGFEPIFH